MKTTAIVENSFNQHAVTVSTNGNMQNLPIPGKSTGLGSAVNGGEFLFLALATCFCNDIYREAGKRSIKITKVKVEASGEFSAEGAPGYGIVYKTQVEAEATDEQIAELIQHTDQVSEIQNTLRTGVAVTLVH